MAAASQRYFDKVPRELNTQEVATLVAMTKTPERYNPRSRPDTARARRDLVLDVFVREGLLEREQAEQAKRLAVETAAGSPAE